MKNSIRVIFCLTLAGVISTTSAHAENSLKEALTASTVSGDFRLRYEDVDRDDLGSDGLTLRSRVMLKTDGYHSFSAVVEIEDVRNVLGVDDERSLIPDPEVTEIDQAFIQYAGDKFISKLGRQVITLDGHRFVGHVGWRQDRQTFDAFRTTFTPSKDLTIDASYIYKRNRIFAETLDAKSNDFLLNASYKTPLGMLTAYGYLLDDDARDEQSDTFGVSFNGMTGDAIKFLFHLEYATQSIEDSGVDFDTDYMLAEGGFSVSGVTAKFGYEVLGSDGGVASFTTPLATLHKFNGWNDIFLGGTFNPTAMPNGLEDMYVTLATKFSGVAIAAFYHDYRAEEGSANYGDEASLVITKAFRSGASLQAKYSNYSADTFGLDTEKLWLTMGYKF